MSRSFVVGKRSSRVVFGRFCAETVVNEQTTIVIEKEKKRESIFIEQRERSEQSGVERIGCNSDFIPRLDAVPWRIGFKVNWHTDVRLPKISARTSLGANDTWRKTVRDKLRGGRLNNRSWNGSVIRMHGSDC